MLAEAVNKGAVREEAHNKLRDIMLTSPDINKIRESDYFSKLLPNLDELISINLSKEIGTSISDAEASLSNAKELLTKNQSLINDEVSLNL